MLVIDTIDTLNSPKYIFKIARNSQAINKMKQKTKAFEENIEPHFLITSKCNALFAILTRLSKSRY